MTKKEVDEVLHYVAKEIISPLCHDKRTGDEIWDEMIGHLLINLWHLCTI